VNVSFLQHLHRFGIHKHEILIDDVQSLIEREQMEILAAQTLRPQDWFSSYHTYDEIVTFTSTLAFNYSKLASFIPAVGKSIEGREINILRITGGTGPKKGQILLLGGQHAREWIGPATVLYAANTLLSEYASNPDVAALVNNFDWTIVPVLNPDGYVFTWNNNRLWRKNRRVNSNGSFGVDLNRNWGDHWCEDGGSTNPNSDTYCGTGPFS